MNDDSLQLHGRALEEAFFVERNQRLLAELREKMARDDLRDALRDSAKTLDDATLEFLVKQGIRPDTLAAVKLVPLVVVCWANGVVEPAERKTVLEAAERENLHPGDPAYRLLESCLDDRPGDGLFEAWERYVRTLIEKSDAATVAALKKEILGLSRDVAESAGKLFGLFLGTSAEEKAVLKRIEQAFDR